jgi:hypothetical protein
MKGHSMTLSRICRSTLSAFLILGFALSTTSCNDSKKKYIDKAVFDLSPDLKSARVTLVFTDLVKSSLKTTFNIKDYGNVFTVPYMEGAQAFQAGFDLNMDVIYDNDFIEMTPTLNLPNGMTTGVSRPLVQISAGSLGDGAAEFLAYVDISEWSWLGMATMIKKVDEQFPQDLIVSQVFLRDSAGEPAVFGSFFGPKLNADGTVAKSGGLAIFANVKALAAARGDAQQPVELRSEPGLILSGKRASFYRSNPAALEKIGALYSKALSELQ